eukprot:489116_1
MEPIILCFIFIVGVQSIACDPPIDLNKATLSELASLPYITSDTAQLIINARPICSPIELTNSRKIEGITVDRLDNNWNWSDGKECSDTCCIADASCESPGGIFQANVAVEGYYFQPGDWNTCTSECGVGVQHRNVQCANSDGITDDIYCATLYNKPIEKRVCNNGACAIYEWITDVYGECITDSQGICSKKRTIKCYDIANGEPVDDSECEAQNIDKPEDTKECKYCKKEVLVSSRSLLSEQTTQIGDITVTVDLLNDENAEICNTDMFRDIDNDKTLVTRRACATTIDISVNGIIGSMDKSWFDLDCTLQAMVNEDDNGQWYNNYLSYTSNDLRSGRITIDIPSDGNIGEFVCNLYFQNNGIRLNKEVIADFTLFVLFNPYSSLDVTYMDNLVDRREYVENEFGLIWVGSSNDNTARTWIYDQYYFPNLKISMDTLKRLSLEYRNNIVVMSRQISFAITSDICYGKWGEGPYTTGHPWGGYECERIGRKCYEPWAWTGTTEMFDLYRDVLDSEYKVQYCQCWVYAGVYTTVGRALGIPTRPTTNFQSAHDSDFNRAIESYWLYDTNANTISRSYGSSSDSVWNFHVWNEMFFERDDFILQIYNTRGWQAVDATPQELSYGGNPALSENQGAYQMGPATIALIQDNKNPHQCQDSANGKARFGCFDTEFVISETNANYNLWLKTSKWNLKYTLYDSFLVDPWDAQYGTIGALTNTKKPGRIISDDCLNQAIGGCDDDYLDLTLVYKLDEPSDPGLPTNMTNHYEKGDTSARRRQLLWSDNNFTKDDYDYEGISYNVITIPNKEYISPMIIMDNRDDIIDKYDNDYTYGMIAIDINSYHDNILNIYCSLSVSAYDYSGKQLNDVIKDDVINFRLNPGESSDACKLFLNSSDYSEIFLSNRIRILDSSEIPYMFKFTATAVIFDERSNSIEPYETIIEERDILVCSPLFKLNDRIICRHKLKWFEPINNLDYQCENEDDGISDGFCDEINNYNGCYDGGDCCKQTCIPNKLYKCPYFNCIDERITNKNENFKKCPKIVSFIDYIKDIRESGVCRNAIANLISNNFDFECPQNGISNTENQCIDKLLDMKDKFGEIDSCYKEAFNILQVAIRPIINKIIDCINQQNTQTFGNVAMAAYVQENKQIPGATAIASFEQDNNSGVDGTIVIDGNGNVKIDLDISQLDISLCDGNEIGYAIYNKWNYNENDKLLSQYGPNKCIFNVIGNVYNPFNMPKCDANNNNDYFECELGDLSGRFGVIKVDDNNNKIVIEENISENNNEDESGFCKSRLTPQSLYQRSIVFYCNDDKLTNLFCA